MRSELEAKKYSSEICCPEKPQLVRFVSFLDLSGLIVLEELIPNVYNDGGLAV